MWLFMYMSVLFYCRIKISFCALFFFQVPKLVVYTNFCANQVFGKALLDEKRSDPAIDDFLRRCQESPFSRKLDLWGLLGQSHLHLLTDALKHVAGMCGSIRWNQHNLY